jgi:hypothetical protein
MRGDGARVSRLCHRRATRFYQSQAEQDWSLSGAAEQLVGEDEARKVVAETYKQAMEAGSGGKVATEAGKESKSAMEAGNDGTSKPEL